MAGCEWLIGGGCLCVMVYSSPGQPVTFRIARQIADHIAGQIAGIIGVPAHSVVIPSNHWHQTIGITP